MTVGIFVNGEVNYSGGIYGDYLLTVCNAFFMTIVVWNISKYLKGSIGDFLASIGTNSIVYLCLNQLFIKGIFYFIYVTKLGSIIPNSMIFIITGIGVILLCIITNKFISKTKYLKIALGCLH